MIKSKSKKCRIEIDLTGPEGNAFYLIGMVSRLSKQLNLDGKSIQAEMMKGDYKHLVEVFDREFGQFVTLYK